MTELTTDFDGFGRSKTAMIRGGTDASAAPRRCFDSIKRGERLVRGRSIAEWNLVGRYPNDLAVLPDDHRLAGSLVSEQGIAGGFLHRCFDHCYLSAELSELVVVMGAHGFASALMIPFQMASR